MAVIVPIQTEFDASGVNAATSKFAKFSQTVGKSLQLAGKDARKSFAEIEQGANDSSTAAQRLAASITKTANTLDTELKASTAAADALGSALGPEFASKVGRNGLNKLVTDLNRAGVSINDITAEADVLAAAIKQVDDVNLKHVSAEADQLKTSMSGVAKSTDRSRSVMANFAGNAAQEIPGVTNLMGPLNVAVGQFAEGAAEGGIQLKQIGKALGPIILLTTGLGVIKGVLAANAAETKYWAENSVIVRDALLGLENPLDVIAKKNKEAMSIKVYDPNKGVFGGTREITDDIYELGLTQTDLTEIVKGGKGAIEAWADTVEGSRKPLRRWALDRDEATSAALVYKYLNDQIKSGAEGTKQAVTQQKLFGDVLTQTASASGAVAMSAGFAAIGIAQQTAATEAATAASEAAAQADRDQANAIDSVRNALYARNNARYAATDADLNAKTAIQEYNKAQKKADKSGKPKDIAAAAEAQRQAERAINGAAGAASSYAEETNKGASATTIATASTRAAVVELNKLRDTVSKDGALTFAVEQWIFLLNSVPKTVETAFGISFGSSVKPVRQTTGIPGLSDAAIQALLDALKIPKLAAGGIVTAPTLALIGENGPEAVTPLNQTSNVPSLNQTALDRTSNSTVTNVFNITGAIDPTSTARQVREVLNKDAQRRGTGTILS